MRFKKLMIISSLLMLSACSHVYGPDGIMGNRDSAYLKAKSTPPLAIPPGLSSSTVQEEYPVPEKNYPQGSKRVNLTPPEL
jgi:uncharacterized lipoprotein